MSTVYVFTIVSKKTRYPSKAFLKVHANAIYRKVLCLQKCRKRITWVSNYCHLTQHTVFVIESLPYQEDYHFLNQ